MRQHSSRLCNELSGEQMRGGGEEWRRGILNLSCRPSCGVPFFVIMPWCCCYTGRMGLLECLSTLFPPCRPVRRTVPIFSFRPHLF